MASWTYPVTDFNTGRLIHDSLPIRCDSFTDGLGVGEGALTGSLSFSAGFEVDDVLSPMRRVIWPCKNNQPYGAYVITGHSPMGSRAAGVGFVGERVDSVFARREIESTMVFRQVDQLVIARNIMQYALGMTPMQVDPEYLAFLRPLPGAAIPWIRLDDSYSGVLRDRLDNQDGYQGARHMGVAEALTNLIKLENGFDYALDYGRDMESGQLFVTVRLGYPKLGNSDVVVPFEYPGNVVDWSYAVDTSDTETYSRAYGAGQGVETLIGSAAIDYQSMIDGWPLLMGSESSTATLRNTVDAASRARLAERTGVNQGWTVKLDKTALGTYPIGGFGLLHVRHRRWPQGRRALVRITGHRIEPARQRRAERVIPTIVEV